MKKLYYLILVFFLTLIPFCFAENSNLLIDDFESIIFGSLKGNLDFGSGNGSSLEVAASVDVKESGNQALKLNFNAVSGGYMWAARGKGLDVEKIGWLLEPEEIAWDKYTAISFYMYGSNSKAKIAFDIKDNGSEVWRFIFEDNFTGWEQVVCPFKAFFARGDWQPESSDKNSTLDFPIKSYQFEILPEAKGTLYFDQVKLLK